MNITKVILHHSKTKDNSTVSWGAIRRYHVNTCGWLNIGYHFGIEKVGTTTETLIGRLPNEQGAHTKGHNRTSLGVCFVGDYDYEPPSELMWVKGLILVRWILFNYRLTPDNVHAHREFANKTCPGVAFDMGKFKDELHMNF